LKYFRHMFTRERVVPRGEVLVRDKDLTMRQI
jgi:hypothetical protein